MKTNWLMRATLVALVLLTISSAAFAQVAISITFAPPALPVYEQPPCPAEGYIWTPGYWAFDNDFGDYYWVPGTWVEPPEVGLLWTPGYWSWSDNRYYFHEGYWGQEVGFYGGIVYGFGYFGVGYDGGRWDRGRFFYNRAVSNVNTTVIRNVYNTTIVNNYTTINRVSYNGGNGGVNARPSARDEQAARERHFAPVSAQTQHARTAREDRNLRASINEGKPPVAATPKPDDFKGRDVVSAKQAGAPYKRDANRNAQPENRAENNPGNGNNGRPGRVIHPNDMPQSPKWNPPSSGDAKRDEKFQKQQDKMQAQQDKDRQKLQQNQEREHQKMQQQRADDARQQQMEQRHQQQTQKLEDKQQRQRENLQKKEQPQRRNPPANAHNEHPN